MPSTATSGAPTGNENAKKPRIWSDALRKYAVQNPKVIAKAVESMWLKASDGDVSAMKEIADRLEGKPLQGIEQKTEHSGKIEVAERPKLTREEWLASLVS